MAGAGRAGAGMAGTIAAGKMDAFITQGKSQTATVNPEELVHTTTVNTSTVNT